MDALVRFFQQVYFSNSIANYSLIVLILVFTLVLRVFIPKWVAKLFTIILTKRGFTVETEKVQDLVHFPLRFLIFFVGIWTAFQFYHVPETWKAGGEWLTNDKGIKVYKAKYGFFEILSYVLHTLLVFSIARMFSSLASSVSYVLKKHIEITQSRDDDQLVPLLYQLSKVIIYTFAIIFILGNVYQLNVSGILTGVGIGGVAIALAAQETIGNFISSLAIVLDKPFQIGDYIKFGTTEGTVEQVGFRSTRIRALDQNLLVVPNRTLTAAEVQNISKRTSRRVFYTLKFEYNTNPSQLDVIKTDILSLFRDDERFIQDKFNVHFSDFGAYALELQVCYHVINTEFMHYMNTVEEIIFNILRIVEKNGATLVSQPK